MDLMGQTIMAVVVAVQVVRQAPVAQVVQVIMDYFKQRPARAVVVVAVVKAVITMLMVTLILVELEPVAVV